MSRPQRIPQRSSPLPGGRFGGCQGENQLVLKCGSCDASVLFGFKSQRNSEIATVASNSVPAFDIQWTRNLHSLLQDSKGLDLFRRYLNQEGRSHADPLNFWFACEGLKEERDPNKIRPLVKLIYKRFFVKAHLPAIPKDIREEVDRRVKEDLMDERIFDVVQIEVERLISETIYPKFLRSDIYFRHVRPHPNSDPDSYSGVLLTALRRTSESIEDLRKELKSLKNVLTTVQKTGPLDAWLKSEANLGEETSVMDDGQRNLDKQQRYTEWYGGTRKCSNINEEESLVRCTIVPEERCVETSRRRRRRHRHRHHCHSIESSRPDSFARVLIEKLESIKREREMREMLDVTDPLREAEEEEEEDSSGSVVGDVPREKSPAAIFDRDVSQVRTNSIRLSRSSVGPISLPRCRSCDEEKEDGSRIRYGYSESCKEERGDRDLDVCVTSTDNSDDVCNFSEGDIGADVSLQVNSSNWSPDTDSSKPLVVATPDFEVSSLRRSKAAVQEREEATKTSADKNEAHLH